jgi:hypothetical protein
LGLAGSPIFQEIADFLPLPILHFLPSGLGKLYQKQSSPYQDETLAIKHFSCLNHGNPHGLFARAASRYSLLAA